jgi:hypothetical protein
MHFVYFGAGRSVSVQYQGDRYGEHIPRDISMQHVKRRVGSPPGKAASSPSVGPEYKKTTKTNPICI